MILLNNNYDRKLASGIVCSSGTLGQIIPPSVVEFHTKMNTMGAEVIEGINKAISVAEKNYKGLVIGNEGDNFSASDTYSILCFLDISFHFIFDGP